MAGTKNVDVTALGVGVVRMMENFYPEEQRLFTDEVSKHLLPSSWRISMGLLKFKKMRQRMLRRRDKQFPGVLGVIPVRTRFLDDAVRQALAQGTRQIVILGAGIDTRPYRIEGIEEARVYEVDRPSVQEYKKDQLVRWQKTLPGHVTYVPTNFNKQSLDDTLGATDIDREVPTLFLWEGVTQYLQPEGAAKTLSFVRTFPQAELVFSYVPQAVIDRTPELPYLPELLDGLEKAGNAWYFGIDPARIGDFAQQHGFELLEDVGAEDHQERFIKPLGRDLQVAPIERIARVRPAVR